MIYNVYRFRDSIRKKMTDGKLKKSQTQTGKKRKTARTVNWEKRLSLWVKRWVGQVWRERGENGDRNRYEINAFN